MTHGSCIQTEESEVSDQAFGVFIWCMVLVGLVGVFIRAEVLENRVERYHSLWCEERLIRASVAADSLMVYKSDPFCFELVWFEISE
jgi:hypothetical protein